MFRVTFMTKDEKLGVALKALLGIAVGKPDYEPVHDVEAKNGKAVEAPLLTTSVLSQLPREFRTKDVAALLRRLNRPASQSSVHKRIKEMVGAKLIKHGRRRGHYARRVK